MSDMQFHSNRYRPLCPLIHGIERDAGQVLLEQVKNAFLMPAMLFACTTLHLGAQATEYPPDTEMRNQ